MFVRPLTVRAVCGSGRRKTGTCLPWPNAGRSRAFTKDNVTSIYELRTGQKDRSRAAGVRRAEGVDSWLAAGRQVAGAPGILRSSAEPLLEGHRRNPRPHLPCRLRREEGDARTMPDCTLGHLPCREPPGQHGFGHTRRRVQRHRGAAPALPVNKDDSPERQRCGQRFRQISVPVGCGLQLRSG